MLHGILSTIICSEYEKSFKNLNWERTQSEKPIQGMELEFSLNINYDVEDGYRRLKMLIFNQYNYVSVFAKQEWEVIPSEGLEEDEILSGYDDTVGSTPWVHFSAHDSCWRSDGVSRILHLFHKDILGLSGISDWYSDWYKSVVLTDEEVKVFNKITDDTRKGLLTHSSQFTSLAFTFPPKK